MINIKGITTQEELSREIADTELEIERHQQAIKAGWASVKEEMRPANLVRGLFSSSGNQSGQHNNIDSTAGLPVIAAKMAAGFLINRWMVKKSYGATKMAAGLLIQSGLASMLSNWVSKKLKRKSKLQSMAPQNGISNKKADANF